MARLTMNAAFQETRRFRHDDDPGRPRRLSDLLDAIDVLAVSGDTEVVVRGLCADSRDSRNGYAFFAVAGAKEDGARYVEAAIAAGAAVIFTETETCAPENVTVVRVRDCRAAKSRVAAEFFGFPSLELPTVGVTGTNGKTTTAKMIQAIAEYDRGPCVFLGTTGDEIAGEVLAAPNTTPDPIVVHEALRRGLTRGARLAAMEVSSHALEQGRVADVDFQVGVFTNLTPEHLDYHATLAAYRDAKSKLFESLRPGAVAVLNADDPASETFASRSQARVIRYGLERRADVTARVRRIDIDGLWFTLLSGQGEVDVVTRLVGRYNLMNALAAASTALALGFPLEAIRGGLARLRGVPGRLESVDCGQDFRVLVDYAHTDDALAKVLVNLRPLTHGRLITVFGCGGDRDRTKRPRMGRVAAEYSDLVIVTSDNPRSEDPGAIAAEILAGVPAGREVELVLDRRAAIERALKQARGGDIVLIAGKGHEDYQILLDRKIRFDDREVAREILWTL
jgi:UDP-N-acetylmuramoyl-L-alanyl-D-glutamate--2,6-diaminopimelate ligase